MAVFVALASALFYAVAVTFQQTAAQRADPRLSLRPGLVVELARQPLWMGGIGANAAAYGLRAVALGLASLALVQPLLVCGVLLALPMSAMTGRRITRLEWSGAAVTVVGLSLFLIAAHPTDGLDTASASRWLGAVVVTAIVIGVMVSLAQGSPGRRTALLAAAGGCAAALTAAFTKAAAGSVKDGLAHAATSWAVPAVVLTGVAALLLIQSAYQSGPLTASVPMVAVIEPAVSVVLGVALFHEQIAHSAGRTSAEVLGVGLVVVGLALIGNGVAVNSRV
jgi:hypothetical protein